MKTVLCFGDSNTWGYIPGSGERFSFSRRWTGILQNRLGNGVRIIEEGLNGRTTVWNEPFRPGRNGIRALIPILESHAPIDLLVIFLGTNDLKHFYNATAFDSARGANALISTARSTRAGCGNQVPKVFLIAPPVMASLSEDMALQFNKAREKSESFGEAFLAEAQRLDCYFLDASQIVQSSPIDGIHLDEDAHRKLGLAMADRIDEVFSTHGDR